MKHKLLFFLTLVPWMAFSQDSTRSDIALGISSYFFQYQEHQDGSTAIGPTVLLCDNDVSLQLGILLDLQKYEQYDYGNTQATPSISTARALLIPVFGQYRFYQKEKTTLFATLGVIIGGKYYLDREGKTQTTDAFSFVAGAGASYQVFGTGQVRLQPTFRYCQKEFNFGVLAELIFFLNP